MKQIINGYVLMAIAIVLLASCKVAKPVVQTPQPAPPKPVHRAVQIAQKYDTLSSNTTDSGWLPIQDMEKQVTSANDRVTIDNRIDSSIKIFKSRYQAIITEYIYDWSSYVSDSAGTATRNFKPVRITMRAVKNPRVSEILEEVVAVNGIGKNFTTMLYEAIEVGKKSMYFMQGEDSTIFDAVKNIIPYYYPRIRSTAMVLTSNMSVVIRDNIKNNPKVFTTPGVGEVKNGHITYQASTGVQYWAWFVAECVGNYLSEAMKANVHRRHKIH